MNVYDTLESRGFIAQVTDREAVRELLGTPGATFYIGFDPTADSLHVGHFLQLIVMAHMQRAGHRPIAILGTGTAMVGDPSGKTDMRKMLAKEQIQHNAACFRSQMSRLVDFEGGRALMVDNADWLLKLNYVDFLREIGSCFSVNRMLAADCYSTRLETGLSFLEFNYMPMQSYDFLHLYRTYGCRLQLGGDDQWSNILGGTELIRRKEGADAFGLTFRLLTNSEGKKMGKTEKGAVWLDPEKTSPFDFYQYWRNVDDADVANCLRLLTFLPLEEIAERTGHKDESINQAKKTLAFEVTALVHGEEKAAECRALAEDLFEKGGRSGSMPTTEVPAVDLERGVPLLDLLVQTGLAPSKGEARRLVQQSGITVNDAVVSDATCTVGTKDLKNGEVVLRKGKKNWHRIIVG
jgi:tyrosyl-tRNA synthetase